MRWKSVEAPGFKAREPYSPSKAGYILADEEAEQEPDDVDAGVATTKKGARKGPADAVRRVFTFKGGKMKRSKSTTPRKNEESDTPKSAQTAKSTSCTTPRTAKGKKNRSDPDPSLSPLSTPKTSRGRARAARGKEPETHFQEPLLISEPEFRKQDKRENKERGRPSGNQEYCPPPQIEPSSNVSSQAKQSTSGKSIPASSAGTSVPASSAGTKSSGGTSYDDSFDSGEMTFPSAAAVESRQNVSKRVPSFEVNADSVSHKPNPDSVSHANTESVKSQGTQQDRSKAEGDRQPPPKDEPLGSLGLPKQFAKSRKAPRPFSHSRSAPVQRLIDLGRMPSIPVWRSPVPPIAEQASANEEKGPANEERTPPPDEEPAPPDEEPVPPDEEPVPPDEEPAPLDEESAPPEEEELARSYSEESDPSYSEEDPPSESEEQSLSSDEQDDTSRHRNTINPPRSPTNARRRSTGGKKRAKTPNRSEKERPKTPNSMEKKRPKTPSSMEKKRPKTPTSMEKRRPKTHTSMEKRRPKTPTSMEKKRPTTPKPSKSPGRTKSTRRILGTQEKVHRAPSTRRSNPKENESQAESSRISLSVPSGFSYTTVSENTPQKTFSASTHTRTSRDYDDVTEEYTQITNDDSYTNYDYSVRDTFSSGTTQDTEDRYFLADGRPEDGDGLWSSHDGSNKNFPQTVQKFAIWCILITAFQLAILLCQMSLCGVATLDANYMIGPFPDAFSEWGGINVYLLLEEDQYFRLITPIFLNTGLLQLLVNMYCLMESCAFLEREWGSLTWIFLYLLSGLGACLFTSVDNPDEIGVCSSGALLGLYAAKIAQAVTRTIFNIYPDAPGMYDTMIATDHVGGSLCSVGLLSFLVFFTYIDWSGHLGGAMLGFLGGLVVFSREIHSCCGRFIWSLLGLSGSVSIILYLGYRLFFETEADEDLADVCTYFRNLFPEGYSCDCVWDE